MAGRWTHPTRRAVLGGAGGLVAVLAAPGIARGAIMRDVFLYDSRFRPSRIAAEEAGATQVVDVATVDPAQLWRDQISRRFAESVGCIKGLTAGSDYMIASLFARDHGFYPAGGPVSQGALLRWRLVRL